MDTEVLTGNPRSVAAKKMWERRKLNPKPKQEKSMSDVKFDSHLFIGAASIVITLGSIIFGCYFSLRNDLSDIRKEITKIETVLIIKGVAPPELFATDGK